MSGVPVLMYHAVSAVDRGPLRSLAVPPERLREQLTTLIDAGYRLVGLSEAVDLATAGEAGPIVGLTFDDGYLNFLRYAVPLLAECGATATLYLSIAHMGAPAGWLGPYAPAFGRLLNWGELDEVVAAGIEVGNHSLVHHPLDVLPPAQLDREVRDSHDLLAGRLGAPIRSFCYPHGYHGRQVRETVVRYGYDNACEVGRRLYRPGRDDRLAVPRLQPTPDHDGLALLRLVRTGGPPLVPALKRVAGPPWRLARWTALRTARRTLR